MEIQERLNGDVLHYVIVKFICVDRSKEDETHGTEQYIQDRCYDTLFTVYTLRSVCRFFYMTIETSQILWPVLLQHTRRSMVPGVKGITAIPNTVPLQMPSSITNMKEFIRLDRREYRMRMILASLVDANEYGCYILGSHRCSFDHTRVVLQKYIRPNNFLAMSTEERLNKRDYDRRLFTYRHTVRRMNQLCGGIRKDRRKEERVDRYILLNMMLRPKKRKAYEF